MTLTEYYAVLKQDEAHNQKVLEARTIAKEVTMTSKIYKTASAIPGRVYYNQTQSGISYAGWIYLYDTREIFDHDVGKVIGYVGLYSGTVYGE